MWPGQCRMGVSGTAAPPWTGRSETHSAAGGTVPTRSSRVGRTCLAPSRFPCRLPSSGADVGDPGRSFEMPRLARNSRCPVLVASLVAGSVSHVAVRPAGVCLPAQVPIAGGHNRALYGAVRGPSRPQHRAHSATNAVRSQGRDDARRNGREGAPELPTAHPGAGTWVGTGAAHAALHALPWPALKPVQLRPLRALEPKWPRVTPLRRLQRTVLPTSPGIWGPQN